MTKNMVPHILSLSSFHNTQIGAMKRESSPQLVYRLVKGAVNAGGPIQLVDQS
jgi:hypothetical protein